ncbi:MAG: hypothetical protein CME62_14120 [Halobacteriovoraceae bacterium]|nr:hypothetical protein [Halobacteriovoraceae bacterium]|tara:strand:+ start:1049 stop:1888 length:840 start_codon:yes stop_codon:yes gene_type:complete
MYKVPAKHKRTITTELKKFLPLIHNLQARGKQSSEDDARILLNDILNYVLGYDKYNELRTEMREKNNRFDYVVKITDGPHKRKKDRYDFVIEAKAAHVKLKEDYVNQTLSYCLSKGMDYFFLTNAVKWQLYSVKHSKKNPTAKLLHEVDFSLSNSVETLAEEFYLFSKASYLNGDWKNVCKHAQATKVEDVVALLLSDKIIKTVAKELSKESGIKVHQDIVKDIVENQIVKSEVNKINKRLLKKINTPAQKKASSAKKTSLPKIDETQEQPQVSEVKIA